MAEEREIRIEYVDFVEVQKWPRNPKDHDIHETKKSFHRFGFTKPILIDEGTGKLVAGHGRLETLEVIRNRGEVRPNGIKEVDGKWLIPVLRGVKFDDPYEAEAYLLADNRLSEIGGWKRDVLKEVLSDMDGIDGILDGTGFDISDYISPDLDELEDNADKGTSAEVSQDKWNVKQGDIFQLGNHFIYCADSTSPQTYINFLGQEKITGIVTSPPYAERRKSTYGGINQDDYVEWFRNFQEVVKSIIKDDGHFFLNIKPHTAEAGEYKNQIHPYVNELVFRMQTEWGWCLIDEYCWPHMVPPRRVVKKFRNSWEPIYWFTKQVDFKWYPEAVKGTTDTAVYKREKSWGKWSNLQGSRTYFVPRGEKGESYPSNVLYLGRVVDSRHPAQYPEMLPIFFMTACSLEGEKWLDPFCGSGTTLFAAESTGRIGYGIEQDEKYVALVLEKAHEKGMSISKVQGE